MQKTFLSNLVLIILLNLIVKPLWVLGIDVKVQNILGPETYGDYFSLVNFAFLFTVLLDFGLTNYNNRKISQNPGLVTKTIAETAILKFMLVFLFGIVMISSAIFINYTSSEIRLLKLIAAMLFLQSFLVFLRSNISGIQWYRADVLLSVLDKSLMILIIGVFIWGDFLDAELSIFHFITGQCLAYGIAIVIALGLIVYKVKTIELNVRLSSLITLLKESAPYALLAFLMMVYFKIDAVMIERILVDGDLQAGYYAQAYKLLEAAVMFALLFSTLLLPMFSRMLSASQKVNQLVKLSSRLLLAPCYILVVVLIFYGRDLIGFMFTSDSSSSAAIFPLLIATLIPLGASYIFGTLITADGKLALLNKISILAISLNVVMNYFLISALGIKGAALSTLITQSFVSVFQWRYCFKKFEIQITQPELIRILGFTSSVLLVSFGMYYVPLYWMVRMISSLLIGVSLAFVFGIISVRFVREIINLPS